MPTSRAARALLVLLAASLILLFVDLGGSSIWDANEAFYVETPREMIERGDYVFPTFNYEPRLNKPVLSYWIVAGLYNAFGVSVGVQRFGIAVGGVLLVMVAFVLARTMDRLPQCHAVPAALIAATGLAVDPRLMMFARRIFIDIWISAFMALTLMFFALSERFPERRRLFLVLMYVCVGLGVLTKGPIAAALPGLVFALYLLVHRELRRATQMMIPVGILIVLAIVVPWYYALYLRDGWTYITSFFIGENFGRFTSGIGQLTRRPWWFYLPVVFGDGLPLSVFLVPAAVLWLRAIRADRIQTLLWLWVLTIVVFFSFSHDKQDLYVFPIVPAVAALGASAIARRDHAPRLIWGAAAVLVFLLAVAGGAVLYVFEGAGRLYAIEGGLLVGGVALGGALVAAGLLAMRKMLVGILACFAALAAINWLMVLEVLPDFERYKPVPQLADYLRPAAAADDVIATYEVALPSLVYYLRRHVDVHYGPDERRTFIASARGAQKMFGVLSERHYTELAPELGPTTCVVRRVPTFDVKLRNVLARDPLPHLVLFTNRCEGVVPSGVEGR